VLGTRLLRANLYANLLHLRLHLFFADNVKDVSYFRSSAIKFSSWRSKIISITIHMLFVMRKLTLTWFPSEHLASPFQLLYRQCSLFMSVSSTERTAEPLGTTVLQRHSLALPHEDNERVNVYVLAETLIFQ
jgi:hypothetical protein